MNQNDFFIAIFGLLETQIASGIDPFVVYNDALEAVEEYFDETGLLSSEGLTEDE